MRGVKEGDLMAMVEFLYNGEANVDQGNLDAFHALADELRLKGLNGTSEGEGEKRNQASQPPEQHETVNKPSSFKQIVPFNDMANQAIHQPNERALALNNSSTDENLDNQIRSMMKKSENNAMNTKGKARICKVCGKEGNMTTIQTHIESNHITGLVHNCTVCGTTSKTRDSLRVHLYKHNE